VDIASSSDAAVADAEVGTTATDDAALQDLTTQLAEQDSATAEGPLDAVEVVEIPVPLEELSIRALQI
jgi:hypothetical protein